LPPRQFLTKLAAMIQVLAENIIQQIAAGEVLERPANLVKELVENAIDADASRVEVRVGAEARSFIIEDNGSGMEKSDLPLALTRHATSKITSAADLWNLETFGFRGEALSCIAGVSRLTLHSKSNKAKSAYQIQADFSKLSEVQTSNLQEGTRIEIEDLFDNVPARLKFLKSASAEMMQIKKVMKTFALSYPQVHFQLFHEGKMLFDFAPQEKKQHRVRNILELKEAFTAYYEKDGCKIEAVFSSPNEVQRSPKNIWLFVQNRWIQDRSLIAAIQSAYESLLMHGQYPNVALWLYLDPQEVDVNVHPTKAQVKFREPSRIFRAVREALRTELLKAPWRKQAVEPAASMPEAVVAEPSTKSFPSFDFEATHFATKKWQDEAPTERSAENLQSVLQTYKEKSQSTPIVRDNWEVQPFWSNLQVLGQANLTYILAQSAEALFLVDQHAAHERIAYEKLMQSWRQGKAEKQSYLFPYTLEMEETALKKILGMREDLEKLGFEFSENAKQLEITAGPALVKDSAIGATLSDMADSLLESEDGTHMEQKISHICATIACHSVIRAGQALSVPEMQSLLAQMDEFPLSTFCPHGRPVYIEYSFKNLDKSFGRIV